MLLLNTTMQEALKELEDNSVDSIVTDPPYGIDFMGKKWDYDVPSIEMWKECLRVLKPGGHLLSFSSARTYHRMAVAVEDAGFEIRDQIMWVYGSGFPKSHNIGKAYDKKYGIERELTGYSDQPSKSGHHAGNIGRGVESTERYAAPITQGNGPWEGWGTALKPSHEPIVVARKPLSEKTILANVEKWGVGALNIDASRVGDEIVHNDRIVTGMKNRSLADNVTNHNDQYTADDYKRTYVEGRWPANFIHDGSQLVLDLFPDVKGGNWTNTEGARPFNNDGKKTNAVQLKNDKSIGSAARFFYVPKVSKKERNEGLECFDKVHYSNDGRQKTNDTAYQRGNATSFNNHPTVKPIELMTCLIRLVTPPGGTTLDPFMGSGSTGCAAVSNGYDFIGVEMEEHSFEIAKTRIEHWSNKQ